MSDWRRIYFHIRRGFIGPASRQYEDEIQRLREEKRELVEWAHMAGQMCAGIVPSHSDARAYYDRKHGGHNA